MQKDNKFFEDMARMAGGAAGGFLDMKREMEALFAAQAEKWLQKMHLVTREEFDTVRGMLAKAREEQEELKARLSALEAASAAKPQPAPTGEEPVGGITS